MKANISIPLNIPIKEFLILFTVVVFTISCSTNVVLTKEAKSSINAVSVSEKIIFPEEPIIDSNFDYGGGNSIFTIILSDIIRSIESNRNLEAKVKISDNIIKIDFSKKLREYFIAQLNENKIFNIVIDEANKENKPDAEFILAFTHGELQKNPSSILNKYRAEICVKGGLVLNPPYKAAWDTDEFYKPNFRSKFSAGIQDPEKHPVVWQMYDCGYSRDSYVLSYFLKKPEKLEEIFTEAIKNVVEKLLKDLKSD